MSDRATATRRTLRITPARHSQLIAQADDLPPRTEDDRFRKLDGTTVTEDGYFAVVAERRAQRNVRG